MRHGAESILGPCVKNVTVWTKQPVREKHITGKKPPRLHGEEMSALQGRRRATQPSNTQTSQNLYATCRTMCFGRSVPLEPDVGQVACAKHGYRVHTDMIRFWWRAETVWQQILHLESEEERTTAVAAYQFLTVSQESSYKKFVDMHSKVSPQAQK